jgi:hypothetical protein
MSLTLIVPMLDDLWNGVGMFDMLVALLVHFLRSTEYKLKLDRRARLPVATVDYRI